MRKFYQQKQKDKFSKYYFLKIQVFDVVIFSELFDMKTEYEQSPIEERRLWREKMRNRFMNKQLENNIIEKSVKFIR
jgi:hypothetical protein